MHHTTAGAVCISAHWSSMDNVRTHDSRLPNAFLWAAALGERSSTGPKMFSNAPVAHS